jgi:hypothetical protein
MTGLSIIVRQGGELVAYGMGDVGDKVLRWLDYHGLLSNICCIAVKDASTNPPCYGEVPVYPVAELGIFYKTATFLIFTAEDKHDEIAGELAAIGCVHIAALSDHACSQIRYELQHFDNDAVFLMRRNQDILMRTLADMQYRIAEQNEVCAVNTAAFAEYRNAFRGRDVVIVATGPTLKFYKPIEGAIHIGVNFAFRREDILFDYYFVQDSMRTRQNVKLEDELLSGLNTVRECVFMGKYLRRSPLTSREFPEYCFSEEGKKKKRYFVDGCYTPQIYQDICFHPIMESGSVIFPAMQFALFAYSRKIYLVGCDTNTNGYFYHTDFQLILSTHIIKIGYMKLKKFAAQYYPDIEIISINPVGLKGLFRDFFTDENKE